MRWDWLGDAHPKNAGPMLFILVGLFAVLFASVAGVVWISVERNAEYQRCHKFMPGVDLSGCDLSGERVVGKNLAGTNLNDADLRNTKLMGSDLSNADLSGARLDGANTLDVVWTGATCPDGTRVMGSAGSASC